MANRYCDLEDACPGLLKASKFLLSADYSAKGFEVIVKGRDGQEYRVFFEYCPFCGTRIDPKFLSMLKVKKRSQG